MSHICVGNLTVTGSLLKYCCSDNGLAPGQRQAIIWSNAEILLTEPLGTNFSEILIEIYTFSFKKVHLKWSSVKWRHFVSASMVKNGTCRLTAIAEAIILVPWYHYSDAIMGMMASQITSLTIVYLTVHSGTDQRKHQSSASLAFVWEIHRWPVNFPHKWPVTRKMFPFDDVIMWRSDTRRVVPIWVSRMAIRIQGTRSLNRDVVI